MKNGAYQSDLDFLTRHTRIIELTGERGARVAVAPDWQGRVMTSTLSDLSGPGFGWLNRHFIAARKDDPKFNNYGGEDRFWLGPEAGQFGLWFRPGNKFTLDDFKTPAGFNSGPFDVKDLSKQTVLMTRRFSVTNYSGRTFDCDVRRAVRLLNEEAASVALATALPSDLQWVGFESVNALSNAAASPWRRETGLLCVWILGMFNPLPNGTVIAPFVPGEDDSLGSKVKTYFGDIPADRLQIESDYAIFRCDGANRTKIGIPPQRARPVIGSWDPVTNVLTLVTFNLPSAAHRLPYVNSQWEFQRDPFAGDVVNSYNDGRDPITGTVLGPFYELETSSAALELNCAETMVHVHRTFHFSGPLAALKRLAHAVLGVSALPSSPNSIGITGAA